MSDQISLKKIQISGSDLKQFCMKTALLKLLFGDFLGLIFGNLILLRTKKLVGLALDS